MTGLKYKLAHRRAERERWNATDNAQRKRLIQILQELIDQLKEEMDEEIAEKPTPTTLRHRI
jgi:anti-sigma factor RsiW